LAGIGKSVQQLLKDDQAVSHHIKSLTEQLPVIVSNIATCKRIYQFGKLVRLTPLLFSS
jgi:predicted membrane chloride channel (bestrophin family)